MSDAKHIKGFSAEDIIRYHSGEMSALERNALEKAALDDPFLADALEGYQNTSAAITDLEEIKNRLKKRTAKKKKAYLSLTNNNWLRVAAFFIIFIGAGILIYELTNVRTEPTALETPSGEIHSLETNAVTDTQRQAVRIDDTSIGETSAQHQQTLGTNAENINKPVHKNKLDRSGTTEENTVESIVSLSAPETASSSKTIKQAIDSSISANANAFKDEAASFTFKGRVVDAHGIPIPQASIVLSGTTQGVTTDEKGQFSIMSKDSNKNVTIAAVGLESKKIPLTSLAKENNIVLQESSSALSEVVVVGYGNKARRAMKKSSQIEVEEIEPEEGWASYDHYISENLQVPDLAKSKQIKGEVQLTFNVNEKGEPVNIKVEKSLCKPCDKEAVRLLKDGPTWKKRKGIRGKIKISF